MNKDNKRLREGLERLFKARGEMPPTTSTNKKSKTNKFNLKQDIKMNGDKKKQKINDKNKIDAAKPKIKPPKKKPIKNVEKKQNGKISKDEKSRKTDKSIPPGFFVRNPNGVEEKTNSNKKPSITMKNLKQENEKPDLKRKSQQQKGPIKNKKPKKILHESGEDNELTTKNEKTAKQHKTKRSKEKNKIRNGSIGNDVSPYEENSTKEHEDNDIFLELDAINSDNDDYDSDSASTDSSDTTEEYSSYDSDFEASDYDFESSENYSTTYEDDDSEDYEHFEDSNEDPDYMLPKDELEDLIIHQGLAVKHNLSSKHKVNFDDSIEDGQIVDLPNESPIKTVKQPEAYDIECLRTLELKFIENLKIKHVENDKGDQQNQDVEEDEECPKLVPIDDVNFRLWTSGISMDDKLFSDYEDEVIESDEESITIAEGNINNKYLKTKGSSRDFSDSEEFSEDMGEHLEYNDDDFYDDTDDDEDEIPKKKFEMKADVITTNQKCERLKNLNNSENESSTEDSLAEIITQTENCVDFSKVIIKSANVMPVLKKNELKSPPSKAMPASSENSDLSLSYESPQTIRHAVVESNSLSFSGLSSPKLLLNNDLDMEMPEVTEILETSTNDVSTTQMEATKSIEITKPKEQFSSVTSPTFKTQFFNSLDAHQVLVLLKTPFYIYGTVKATLISGVAEIYGYKLEKWSTQQLFSPRGCCALEIRPLRNTTKQQLSLPALKEEILATIGTFNDICEFRATDVERLLAAYEPNTDAILLIARNDEAQNIKRMLQQHVNENIFPPQISLSRSLYATESLLDCIINTTAEYPLQIPQDWLKLYMTTTSKYLLVGGKSVGKSTLLRYLLNSNLNKFPKILLIDLDIGQPEIFASQAVSCALMEQPLLGPGFLYGIEPDKAYVVAHFNIQLCAHQYMLAVIELLQYCYNEPRYRDIPWIVNTMGYNKGFGAEIISIICEHLRPTDIVQLQSNISINNFDFLFKSNILPMIERHIYYSREYATENTEELDYRLHVIPTAVQQQSRYQREWQMSAKDMRYIMLLTHLSQILTENGEILNQEKTYCRNINDIHVVSLIPKEITSTEMLKSSNANLVYLCYNDGNTKEGSKAEKIECFGIGIVRGIDFHAGKIYILTSLPLQRLMKANCLALSEMPLPATLLSQQNVANDANVPFVQNVSDEATSRAIRQFYYRT